MIKTSKIVTGFAFVLSASALAQPPTSAPPTIPAPTRTPPAAPSAPPTPSVSGSPVATSDYALIFNQGLSKTLAGSLALGQKQTTTTNNCTISGASDGPIVCITDDSCAPGDGMQIPTCMALFNGPVGLNTQDVAVLRPVTRSSEGGGASPGPSGSPTRGTSGVRDTSLSRVIDALRTR